MPNEIPPARSTDQRTANLALPGLRCTLITSYLNLRQLPREKGSHRDLVIDRKDVCSRLSISPLAERLPLRSDPRLDGGSFGHTEPSGVDRREAYDARLRATHSEEAHVARTSTYLNFDRSTEAAFTFYKSVFGTEFVGGIMRHGDVPPHEGQVEQSDEDKQLVVNVQLPILGGHLLMGTDAPESMGFKVNQGNNVYICLEPDTRAEADTLFAALSEGGKVEMPLQEMFWGDYFGSLVDQYGVQWMINCTSKS
jgi:PhnB protein